LPKFHQIFLKERLFDVLSRFQWSSTPFIIVQASSMVSLFRPFQLFSFFLFAFSFSLEVRARVFLIQLLLSSQYLEEYWRF
jgi:hypothetical protein